MDCRAEVLATGGSIWAIRRGQTIKSSHMPLNFSNTSHIVDLTRIKTVGCDTLTVSLEDAEPLSGSFKDMGACTRRAYRAFKTGLSPEKVTEERGTPLSCSICRGGGLGLIYNTDSIQ